MRLSLCSWVGLRSPGFPLGRHCPLQTRSLRGAQTFLRAPDPAPLVTEAGLSPGPGVGVSVWPSVSAGSTASWSGSSHEESKRAPSRSPVAERWLWGPCLRQ